MGSFPKYFSLDWIHRLAGEGIFLFVCIYLDTLDHSAVSLRSIDEPWMEEINSTGVDKYGSDGAGDVIEEMRSRRREAGRDADRSVGMRRNGSQIEIV